jgi:hypothetical protein
MEGWIALGSFLLLFCAWVVLPSRLVRRGQPADEEWV